MEQQPVQAPVTEQPSAKKRSLSLPVMFILGIVGVLAIATIIGYVVVAKQVKALSMNPTVISLAGVFGMPAASINGENISYADYAEDFVTLKKFYTDNPEALGAAPTDEQLSDQVMSRLLANTMINSIAKTYNVTVKEEDVEAAKKEILSGFPDEASAETELQARYGWSLDTYVDKVVRPVIREQALQEAFGASTDEAGKAYEETGKTEVKASHILFRVDDPTKDGEVKSKATEILKRALAGEDFAALAKEFGSDSTKDTGGDLGWFGEGVMVPEFQTAAFALEPGNISKDLVKTSFGYHIIKVEGKRTPRSFVKFMDDQLKSADIRIFINVRNPFEGVGGVSVGE